MLRFHALGGVSVSVDVWPMPSSPARRPRPRPPRCAAASPGCAGSSSVTGRTRSSSPGRRATCCGRRRSPSTSPGSRARWRTGARTSRATIPMRRRSPSAVACRCGRATPRRVRTPGLGATGGRAAERALPRRPRAARRGRARVRPRPGGHPGAGVERALPPAARVLRRPAHARPPPIGSPGRRAPLSPHSRTGALRGTRRRRPHRRRGDEVGDRGRDRRRPVWTGGAPATSRPASAASCTRDRGARRTIIDVEKDLENHRMTRARRTPPCRSPAWSSNSRSGPAGARA